MRTLHHIHSSKRGRFARYGARGTASGSRFVSLFLCLCMAVSMLCNFGGTMLSSSAEHTVYASNRIVDMDTSDTYRGKLLSQDWGSRYAGRVWTDKSVFAYNTEILLDMLTDGYDGKVTFDSDFGILFSALASSQVVNEPSPLDVMFVIDVSGSMGQYLNESGAKVLLDKDHFGEAPIAALVKSVNSTIVQFLSLSPESRFGIAIYGSTAAVLVPLGHYEKSETVLSTDYLEQYGSQGLHFTLNATVTDAEGVVHHYYADNAGLTSNAAHGISAALGDGNRLHKGTSGHTTGTGTATDPYHVGHITNPQAGFAAAMGEFIEKNREITWKNVNNDEYQRIPTMIHLTDGQASDIAWIQPSAATGTEAKAWEKEVSNWYNVNWRYDLAYNSLNRSGRTNPDVKNAYNASQLTGAGDAAPVIFQTLMTAAYYKSAVEAYYNSS